MLVTRILLVSKIEFSASHWSFCAYWEVCSSKIEEVMAANQFLCAIRVPPARFWRPHSCLDDILCCSKHGRVVLTARYLQESCCGCSLTQYLLANTRFSQEHCFVLHRGSRGAAALWPPAKLNSGHLEIFAAGRPGRPGTRGRFRHARIIKNKGFPLILLY